MSTTLTPLPAVDSEWYGSGWSYDQIIDSFGVAKVVDVELGSYQGDRIVLLRDGERFGFLTFGYGSCSGCDTLEAIGNDAKEATGFRDELWQSVEWKTAREMRTYLADKDWKASYYGDASEVSTFVDAADEVLS